MPALEQLRAMWQNFRARRPMAPAIRYPMLVAIVLLIGQRIVNIHKEGTVDAARRIVEASGGNMTAQQVSEWLAKQGVKNITPQTLRSLSIDRDNDGFNEAELRRVADYFDELASASVELIELAGDAPVSSVLRHVLVVDVCFLILLTLYIWSEMEAMQHEKHRLRRGALTQQLRSAVNSLILSRRHQARIDGQAAAIADLAARRGEQHPDLERLEQEAARQRRQQSEQFLASQQEMEANNGRWFLQLVERFPQEVLLLAAAPARQTLAEAAFCTRILRGLAGLTPQALAAIPHEQQIPVANGIVLRTDEGGEKTIITMAGGRMGLYGVLPPSDEQRRLGGGQGYVSSCQDLMEPDRALLCKRFHPDRVQEREALARELRVQMRLAAHRGIVRFHLVIQTHGDVFMIMRKVQGKDLHGTAAQSEARCKRIIGEVARALRHTHDHGVLHKDLKPENVVLSYDQRDVAIIDYGLACLESERDAWELSDRDIYRPPECEAAADGTKPRPSRAADVYRLGLTLFWLLAAKERRFVSKEGTRGEEEVGREELRDTQWIRGRIGRAVTRDGEPFSEEVQDLLRALLHPEPGERPSVARLLEHEWLRCR